MTNCLDCRFYDRKSARAADARGLQWGLCRHDAPQLNPGTGKSHAIEGVWPTVRDDDWCGRWQAQGKQDAAAPSAAALVQTVSRSAQGPRTQTLGPRTLPMNGGAAAIAAGYKPTGGKNPR